MRVREKLRLIGHMNVGMKQKLTGTINVGDSKSGGVKYEAFIANNVLVVREQTP